MKKPKLCIQGHDMIEWVEVYGLNPEQHKEAYEKMMNALILCHEVLLLAQIWDHNILSDDRKKDFNKAEKAIKEALKSAGCKL